MEENYNKKVKLNSEIERKNPEQSKFFEDILKIIEEEYTIPNHERHSILQEVFPKKVLAKIMSIIPISEPKKSPWDSESDSKTVIEQTHSPTGTTFSFRTASKSVQAEPIFISSSRIKDTVYSSSSVWPDDIRSITNLVSPKSDITLKKQSALSPRQSISIPVEKQQSFKEDTVVTSEEPSNVISHLSSFDPILKQVLNFSSKPKMTVYYNFFKRTDEMNKIWREITGKLSHVLTTEEKVEIISEQIAKRFVNWVRSVNLDDTLTPQVILNLFSPPADLNKIYVRQEEIFAIPGQVGRHLDMKKRTKQWIIVDQVNKDKKAFMTPSQNNSAFGRHLPSNRSIEVSSTNQDFKKWFCTNFPERLDTMEAVFSGITHLDITKRYAQFIANKPYIKPPAYLVECGLFDEGDVNISKLKSVSEAGINFESYKPKKRKKSIKETIFTFDERPKHRQQYVHKTVVEDFGKY